MSNLGKWAFFAFSAEMTWSVSRVQTLSFSHTNADVRSLHSPNWMDPLISLILRSLEPCIVFFASTHGLKHKVLDLVFKAMDCGKGKHTGLADQYICNR